jgi:hypothetical protein
LDDIKALHVFDFTPRECESLCTLMESHKNSKKTLIFLGFFEESGCGK